VISNMNLVGSGASGSYGISESQATDIKISNTAITDFATGISTSRAHYSLDNVTYINNAPLNTYAPVYAIFLNSGSILNSYFRGGYVRVTTTANISSSVFYQAPLQLYTGPDVISNIDVSASPNSNDRLMSLFTVEDFVMFGSNFHNASAGQGCLVVHESTIQLIDVTFDTCVGPTSGAAINFQSTNFNFNQVTIKNSQSTERFSGSAIVATRSSGTVSNSFFSNNNAITGDGGAISLNTFDTSFGTYQFSECTFSGNTAGGRGGAVSIYGNGDGVIGANQTVTFENCLFINNTAVNGGAIGLTNSIASFLSTTFYNNTGTYTAGAISSSAYSPPYVSEVTISNSIFKYNAAKSLISTCFLTGNATITNSVFSQNTNPGLLIGVYLAPSSGDDTTPYVATIKGSTFNDGFQIDYRPPGGANVSDCIILSHHIF